MAGGIRTDAVLLNPLLRIRAACGQLAASAVDFRNSKLDQLTGDILRGGFSEVCMILKILHLNPRKFYQEQYILNETGYKTVAHGKGRVSYMLRRSVQKCCPVSCKKSDE